MRDEGLRPVAAWEIGAVAVVLAIVATVFLEGGSLNIETFVDVQRVTRAWPDTLWAIVTICGTGIVAFGLLAPTLAWQPRWFASALASAAIAGLYTNALKHWFALPRPAAVLDPLQVHVVGDALRGSNSFPSGHSVTAFTLAAVLVLASRRPFVTLCWALPIALLIATSRIAVGAHWPADLAAGAAGGWVSGALGVVIAARWRRWNTPTGVRVMGLIAIGIGVSICLVRLGYPLAIPAQYVAGVIAIASGMWAVARPRLDTMLPLRVAPGTDG